MRGPRDVVDLAKPKEAERKKKSILDRSFSFPLPDLTKQKEAERKKESIEVVIAHNFLNTNVQHVSPGHNENHDAPPGRDGSKIEVLELIILLANFIVELMSIVFDQLSSQHKAPFLLLGLLMSISAVLISISELVYKLIKEMAIWKEVRSCRRCLFDPPSGVRVGFFPCIIALTCAFGQFIITTVNYFLYRKDGNAPIKVSIWPTVFAFGQLFSSLSSRGAKTESEPEPEPEFWPEPRLVHRGMLRRSLQFKPELVPMLESAPQPAPKPEFMSKPELEPELEPKPKPKPALGTLKLKPAVPIALKPGLHKLKPGRHKLKPKHD